MSDAKVDLGAVSIQLPHPAERLCSIRGPVIGHGPVIDHFLVIGATFSRISEANHFLV